MMNGYDKLNWFNALIQAMLSTPVKDRWHNKQNAIVKARSDLICTVVDATTNRY